MTTIRFIYLFSIIFIITACSPPISIKERTPFALPELLRFPVEDTNMPTIGNVQEQDEVGGTELSTIHFEDTSEILPSRQSMVDLNTAGRLPKFNTKKSTSVNLSELPLPAFINEVFGNLLGVSFEIDAKIQRKQELITLRIIEPQSPESLYQIAIQVLKNYNVTAKILDDLVRFTRLEAKDRNKSEISSLIVDGMSLPNIPASHRPVIQFIPLKIVTYDKIIKWIKQAFQGHKLTIQEDVARNAIILIGAPKLIKQVVEAIKILDQPLMRGRYSVRIEPAFLSAETLSLQLINILKTQGYQATSSITEASSIIILPIKETNIIIAFAMSPEILNHIKQWASRLDKINLKENKINQPNIYFYPVKNTTAQMIVEIINQLSKSLNPDKQGQAFIVDKYSNSLLFTGTAIEWAQFLPILKNLDKPPKQVLVEITLAEISLSDKTERGIEWVINQANMAGLDGNIGTLSRLGIGAAGLTYTLSNDGDIRSIINILTTSSLATILSTPRLMVRSGSSASIDIGTEIPTLSSQTSSDQLVGGSSSILQQVQYRSTGMLLSITPIVYAGRQVDLEISQQVSEARENTTSSINSPMIFNRQIKTALSLSDGQTILMGGFISNNHSEGYTGIPILSDIPIIGQLFRVNRESNDRTELIIIITPYIIDNNEEAIAITKTIQDRLELIPLLKQETVVEENK